jgi:hypothetical protein
MEIMVEEEIHEKRVRVKVNRQTLALALGFGNATVTAVMGGGDETYIFVDITQQLRKDA